ncbi:MAG: hypothetical protein QM760_18525 [Nibricoccus sp.]
MLPNTSPRPRTLRHALFIGCLLAFSFLGQSISAAQTTATSAPDPLSTLRRGHPRLLLTTDTLATAQTSAAANPLRAAIHRPHHRHRRDLARQPGAQHIPASDASLDQARYAVHTILTNALAFRLSGDQRFLARAKKNSSPSPPSLTGIPRTSSTSAKPASP